MVEDERLEIGEVQEFCTLSLWEDEVEEEEEAEPGVEGHPAYDEEGPGFNEECQGQDDEVDQPWCCLCWVAEAEGFIGEVAWEDDGCGRAMLMVNRGRYRFGRLIRTQ